MYKKLICLLLFLSMMSPLSSATIANFNLSDDTTVLISLPNTNYGSDEFLYTWIHYSDQNQWAYIKSLSMNGIGTQNIANNSIIYNATLHIYVETVNQNPYLELNVVQGYWTESTLTWNNKPTISGETNLFNSQVSVGWIQINITNIVQQWNNGSVQNNGLRFYDLTSGGVDSNVYFMSKEYSNPTYRPYITVNYLEPQSQITYPSNGSYQNNYTLNITWDKPTSTILYNWQLSDESNFGNISYQGNTSNTYTGLLSIQNNKTYYTRILSNNSGTLSNWSNTVNFNHVKNETISIHPVNNSTLSYRLINLQWIDGFLDSPYTYYLSKYYSFSSLLVSGSESSTTGALKVSPNFVLDTGTRYYWKIKNNTGSYSDIFEFYINESAILLGQLNLTVFDERNTSKRILGFTASVYDSGGNMVRKNATNGWANFSGAEISSGEHLIRIDNASYYDRLVLFDSPGNVTMYTPNKSVPVDTTVFVLSDYTGVFPWSTTKLLIYSNNSLIDSQYFSADAKAPVYLIDMESYSVQIISDGNTRIWGNYIPYTSQEVGVVISTLDETTNIKYYNISSTESQITVDWNMVGNLNYINYSIYKGTTNTLVYSLNSSISSGEINYLKTGGNDTYYIIFNASTINDGYLSTKRHFDDRPVTDKYPFLSTGFTYGTFSIPTMWKHVTATLIIAFVAISFTVAAMWEGAVVTLILANIFYYWKWLPNVSSSGLDYGQGFLLMLFLFSIYLLRSRSSD